MLTIPAKVIASCFAIAAFTAAVLIGWGVGNSTYTIMLRASVIMAACWGIGMVVGKAMQTTVVEHIDRYKETYPIDNDYENELAAPAPGGETVNRTDDAMMRESATETVPSQPQRQVA